MVTVTIYKDGKSWRAKWADRDVPIFDFVFGVGMMKKDKLMENFGLLTPAFVFDGEPDERTRKAVEQVADYVAKVYAEE